MGSFVGHVDGATMYVCVSLWWMFKSFTTYILCMRHNKRYRCQLSYPARCCRREVPVEIILKTVFPFCGLIGEIADNGGFGFVNPDGRFHDLNHIQHISIYAMFVLHGLTELALFYRLPLPKLAGYITGALAFLWYGLSFYYHANMEGKAPLETTIHIMATYIIYVIVACLVVEAAVPGAFTAQLVRCLAVLMLGTWFWHTSFVMYIPGWPGSHANPQWDRHDHTNVHFIIACFGFHLAVNIVVVLVVYVISHVLVYRSHGLMTSQCCHGDDSIALIQQSHNHSKDKHSARSSTSTAAVQMFTDDASDSDGHSDV